MIRTSITVDLEFDEGIYIPGAHHVYGTASSDPEAAVLASAEMMHFIRMAVEGLGVKVHACYTTKSYALEGK